MLLARLFGRAVEGMAIAPPFEDLDDVRVGHLAIAAGGIGRRQVRLEDRLRAPSSAGGRILAAPAGPAVALDDLVEVRPELFQRKLAGDGLVDLGAQIRE